MSQSLKVLVVDDSQQTRDLISQALQELSPSLREVSTALKAQEILSEFEPDLAFVSIDLMDVSFKDISHVFLTANQVTPEMVKEIHHWRASGFVIHDSGDDKFRQDVLNLVQGRLRAPTKQVKPIGEKQENESEIQNKQPLASSIQNSSEAAFMGRSSLMKWGPILLILSVFAFYFLSPNYKNLELPPSNSTAVDQLRHEAFSKILNEHVREGVVDYVALKIDENELNAYIKQLNDFQLTDLSRNDIKALWINAYNACTLKLILEYHLKIKSIKDIPRSKRWIDRRWNVAGMQLSLDDLEKGGLLNNFKDPRIHMALCCASFSCPILDSQAYEGPFLEKQLDKALKRFLADKNRGVKIIFSSSVSLNVSKIFSWYESDFINRGSVTDFIVNHMPGDPGQKLRSERSNIKNLKYFKYDWSLNDH